MEPSSNSNLFQTVIMVFFPLLKSRLSKPGVFLWYFLFFNVFFTLWTCCFGDDFSSDRAKSYSGLVDLALTRTKGRPWALAAA